MVTDGERYRGDPLIDGSNCFPLTNASPGARAIIHHPQGGVRYYQQVLIGVEGRDVVLPDGRPVLPAQSQDIVVSAHLHIAVEGGKLYVEFIGQFFRPFVRNSTRSTDCDLSSDGCSHRDRAAFWGMAEFGLRADKGAEIHPAGPSPDSRAKEAHQTLDISGSYDHGGSRQRS